MVLQPREVDIDIQDTVINDIQAVFEDLQALAVGDPPESIDEIPELPEEETTTTAASSEGDEEAEVPEPEPAVLTGTVFIDVDGDGVFTTNAEEGRVDRGIAGVDIEVRTHQETYNTFTDENGEWMVEYPGVPAVVVVDGEDPDIPDG